MSDPQDQTSNHRYAILTHDHPFFHWDLLLRVGEVAWTWRLLDDPHTTPQTRADRIGDHRLMYLDYEGPVRGDRGHVTQFDSGMYEILAQTETSLTVQLTGHRGVKTLTLPRFALQGSD